MKEAYSPTPWTFFGFGGTPPDAKKFVEPYKCVAEVERVLKRIMDRHGIDRHDQKDAPAVLGWSQGALIAQLVAQSIRPSISRGILAGSIYNPRVTSPPETIYYRVKSDIETIKNHNEVAEKVFHYPRDKTAQQFAEAAMISDPHTAIWRHMSQFNDVDPQRVHLPTLIITGEQDSYSPVQAQIDLYSNLCRGASWLMPTMRLIFSIVENALCRCCVEFCSQWRKKYRYEWFFRFVVLRRGLEWTPSLVTR